MKKVLRIAIVVLGLAMTYAATATPVTPAPDGGPMPLCRPGVPCGY
jgi:hypothetical protein